MLATNKIPGLSDKIHQWQKLGNQRLSRKNSCVSSCSSGEKVGTEENNNF